MLEQSLEDHLAQETTRLSQSRDRQLPDPGQGRYSSRPTTQTEHARTLSDLKAVTRDVEASDSINKVKRVDGVLAVQQKIFSLRQD